MDYREFTGAVEEQMNRRLEGGVRASLYTAVKNNGKERTGVLIEAPGINISPTIYLEEYFEDYQKGRDLGTIVARKFHGQFQKNTCIFPKLLLSYRSMLL